MHSISQPQLFEPWQQYQHPAVRQLAFAVASPNIIAVLPDELELQHAFALHDAAFWQQQYQRYIPRLQQLDQAPDELLAFLATLKSTRLGLRFEMLMWFWLLDAQYHCFQLLGHSIQKIEGPKTLGELDFLILNTETNQIEHWEVALKYYLAEADFSLQHWYGLNRSDTLFRKLNHFSQKQFQFSDALDHQIQKRYAVFKGQLYIPVEQQHNLPHWVNAARRLGHWGYHIPQDQDYYRLQRQEWICVDATMSSPTPLWWTDGLYKASLSNEYYMFRHAPALYHCPTIYKLEASTYQTNGQSQ